MQPSVVFAFLALVAFTFATTPHDARHVSESRSLGAHKRSTNFGRIGLPLKNAAPNKRYTALPGMNPVRAPMAGTNTFKIVKKSVSGKRAFQHSPHTLALTKVQSKRDAGLHPLLYFQQHANRALARKAMCSGQNMSTEDLVENLRNRWVQIGEASKNLKLRKRQAANGTSAGFSQAKVDALIQNSETAGPDLVGNVLGLNIESADVGYFATMQLGTPPKDFNMLVDSGSADTWVPSSVCQSCGTHQALDSGTSTSFLASSAPFQVTYGSGAVQGAIVQDDLTIGNLTLAGHVFGATTDETPQFGDNSVLFDGLMGTARSELSNQQVLTPIESLAKNGDVPSATMGYALGSVADDSNDSTVTFGGVNTAQIAGSLTEVPNVSQVGFWEAAVGDISVDGTSLKLAGRTAILDTGTTLAIIPEADATAIHNAIPGATGPDGTGAYTVPCTTTSQVSFTFGGQTFSIVPQDLTFIPLTNDLQGDCQSAIMAGNVGADTQMLIGDTFLKSVYFATDVDTNTIGLGNRA